MQIKEVQMNTLFTINNISLLYQLVGAVILGWSIAFTPDNILKGLVGTFAGYNRHFLRGLIMQRNDTRFGVMILAFGIIFELMDNVFHFSQMTCGECLNIILVILLIVFCLAYSFLRSCISSVAAEKLFQEIENDLSKK